MQNPLTPLFITHASAGCIMLLSGLVAMAAKKVNKYHRVSGKIYFGATSLVAITGFTIALEKNNHFLLATSIFVMYMVVSGYRSLYLKQLYKEVKAQPIDWLIIVFALIGTLGLLILGALTIMSGNKSGYVPLVFGVISGAFVRRDILKFTKGPVEQKHWLYNHIRGMVGSYIAGLTAFLAVNAGFISHNFSLLVWLAPSAIGTPLIIFWVNKYKAKSNDLSKELGLKIKLKQE